MDFLNTDNNRDGILFALLELSFKLLEELDDWSKDSLSSLVSDLGKKI